MIKRKICAVIFVMAVLMAMAATAAAQAPPARQNTQVAVSAAASLKDAFGDIKAKFEAQNPGTTVVYSFGGSQDLRGQIERGAGADVFASADTLQMDKLVSGGYVDKSAVKNFASNRLAMIVPKSNPGKVSGLSDLSRPNVKLAICAKDVPCGAYTLQMLDNVVGSQAYGTGFKAKVLNNVVSRDSNVNDAVARVAQGKADAAIVYASDVPREMKGRVTMLSIPDDVNVRATYPIAALKQSKNPAAASSFVDYVTSADGQAILARYGFAGASPGQRAPLAAQQPQTIPA